MKNLEIIIPIVSSIIVLGIILILRIRYIKGSSKKKLEIFKSNATKVKVNLLEAKIKSNTWKEEVMTDKTKYAGLNQLNGQPEMNFKLVNKVISHLKVETNYNGIIIEYGTDVNMEPDNLKIHLQIQKETYLHINKNNVNEKYLDLEFLNK